MTSAIEVFTIALARASRKGQKFLTGLSKEDREDIIQSALLWCWEHQESYSLTTSLDTWFVNAVRDAYKAWARQEPGDERAAVGETIAAEEPSVKAEVAQVQKRLTNRIEGMPPREQQIARLLLRQWTRDEIAEKLHVDVHAITEVRRLLAPFKRYLPEEDWRNALVRAVTPKAPTSDDPNLALARIDAELQTLDFPPEHGAECPPCWRCLWFEGWLPGDNKSVRVPIVEADVREAVANTEARKVEIANEVRDGNL